MSSQPPQPDPITVGGGVHSLVDKSVQRQFNNKDAWCKKCWTEFRSDHRLARSPQAVEYNGALPAETLVTLDHDRSTVTLGGSP